MSDEASGQQFSYPQTELIDHNEQYMNAFLPLQKGKNEEFFVVLI